MIGIKQGPGSFNCSSVLSESTHISVKLTHSAMPPLFSPPAVRLGPAELCGTTGKPASAPALCRDRQSSGGSCTARPWLHCVGRAALVQLAALIQADHAACWLCWPLWSGGGNAAFFLGVAGVTLVGRCRGPPSTRSLHRARCVSAPRRARAQHTGNQDWACQQRWRPAPKPWTDPPLALACKRYGNLKSNFLQPTPQQVKPKRERDTASSPRSIPAGGRQLPFRPATASIQPQDLALCRAEAAAYVLRARPALQQAG